MRADVVGDPAWTDVRPAEDLSIDPSGTIRVITGAKGPRTLSIAQSEDDGATWTTRDLPSPRSIGMSPGSGLWIGDDGAAWLLAGGGSGRLMRSESSRWREVDRIPGDRVDANAGRGGTIWFHWWGREGSGGDDPSRGTPQAWARFDGGDLTVFDAAGDVPRLSSPHDGGGRFEVAPDGGLWFTVHDEGVDLSGTVTASTCDGIARFDGVNVSHFLRGMCPWAFAIADDGAVWVVAGADPWYEESPPIETYVIRAGVAMADR